MGNITSFSNPGEVSEFGIFLFIFLVTSQTVPPTFYFSFLPVGRIWFTL